MYKVIVIDDEMLIRKRLILGFDWEKMGYQIEDEAENGQAALELMEKKQYDLAIVDIAMPGMNGIELAQLIRERNYQMQIIFLTGHSDFKYAQQAVQYGVYYYILKPIKEAEFIGVLEKLRRKMDEEFSRKDLLESLEKKQNRMDAVLQAKIFRDYLQGKNKEKAVAGVRKIMEAAGVKDEEHCQLVLVWEEMSFKNHMELPERLVLLEKICEENVTDTPYLVLGDLEEECLILIRNTGQFMGEKETFLQIQNLEEKVEQKTGSMIRCGSSRIFCGIEGLQGAYVEAVSALNNAKIQNEKVLSYQMILEGENTRYRISEQDIKKLHNALAGNHYDQCQQIVEKMFEDMKQRKVSFECLVRNMDRLFLELSDAGVATEMETRMVLNGRRSTAKVLGNMESVEEIAEWFTNVIYTFMQNGIRTSKESKSLPIVEKTCEYIRTHFSDAELTQSEIADAMGVTSPYLSGIFKKAMGISMVQYVTMVRMENARELLQQSGLEVREIAEQVGYHDEYYFSRCFKKQYGFSPMQIRKLSDVRRIKNGL